VSASELSANKRLVGDFYERAINGRDASVCERLLSTGFVHNGEPRGRDGQRAVVQAFLDAFSPLRHKILIMLAEDDLVCAHQRWSGTHVGEFLGHAPTGRQVEFTSTAILRIEDNLIAEAWDEVGLAELFAQLGAG
jgi:predicted ester cyclase